MILTRLKEATRDQHEELERVFDPTVRAFTPGDYRRLPARLYGFYEPLEARLGALPDWSAAGFDFSRRRKTPLLVRDLQS
ncbi:MAG TPA: biliverdin-producing heme oxygenase, partial [Blastocatellia bacterium]|nr:biliverdin-producing heme oxygenase [Blastocatellia bacterium]